MRNDLEAQTLTAKNFESRGTPKNPALSIREFRPERFSATPGKAELRKAELRKAELRKAE